MRKRELKATLKIVTDHCVRLVREKETLVRIIGAKQVRAANEFMARPEKSQALEILDSWLNSSSTKEDEEILSKLESAIKCQCGEPHGFHAPTCDWWFTQP